MRRLSKFSGLVKRIVGTCFVAALVGCGDDEPTIPEADLDGVWNATRIEFASRLTSQVVDVVPEGAVATLNIGADHAYTLTVTLPGLGPANTSGTWELDKSTFRLIPSDGDPASFDATLDGNHLSLRGAETVYDFDDDGAGEPADLNLELDRATE